VETRLVIPFVVGVVDAAGVSLDFVHPANVLAAVKVRMRFLQKHFINLTLLLVLFGRYFFTCSPMLMKIRLLNKIFSFPWDQGPGEEF
jgi:hypothetical protein